MNALESECNSFFILQNINVYMAKWRILITCNARDRIWQSRQVYFHFWQQSPTTWHSFTKHGDSKNAINDKSIYMYRKSRWLHNFLEDMMLELIELVLADQLAREGKRTNGIVCRWGSLQHSHRSHHTHSFDVFASPYIRRSSSCPLWRNKKPECPVKNSWSKHPV